MHMYIHSPRHTTIHYTTPPATTAHHHSSVHIMISTHHYLSTLITIQRNSPSLTTPVLLTNIILRSASAPSYTLFRILQIWQCSILHTIPYPTDLPVLNSTPYSVSYRSASAPSYTLFRIIQICLCSILYPIRYPTDLPVLHPTPYSVFYRSASAPSCTLFVSYRSDSAPFYILFCILQICQCSILQRIPYTDLQVLHPTLYSLSCRFLPVLHHTPYSVAYRSACAPSYTLFRILQICQCSILHPIPYSTDLHVLHPTPYSVSYRSACAPSYTLFRILQICHALLIMCVMLRH